MKIFRFFYFFIFTAIFFSPVTYAEDFDGAFKKEFKKDNLKYTIIIPENTSQQIQAFERIYLHRSADEFKRIKSFYDKFIPCIITIKKEGKKSYNIQDDEFIKNLGKAGHLEALRYNPNFENLFLVMNSSMVVLFSAMLTSLASAKFIDNLVPEKVFITAFIMAIIMTPINFSLQSLSDLRYLPNGYQNKRFQEIINGAIRNNISNDLIRVSEEINTNETFVTVRFIKKEFLEGVKEYINGIDQEFEAQNPCAAQYPISNGYAIA